MSQSSIAAPDGPSAERTPDASPAVSSDAGAPATPGRRAGRRLAALAYSCLLVGVAATVYQGHPVNAGATEPEATAPADTEGFEAVTWAHLGSYPYPWPIPGELKDATAETLAERAARIPEAVRALDGRKVAVRGFLIPLEVKPDGIHQFLLSSKNDMGCCFGIGIAMNEWMVVDVAGEKGIKAQPFTPISVLGTLSVGEDVRDGTVMSVYRLSAEQVRSVTDG